MKKTVSVVEETLKRKMPMLTDAFLNSIVEEIIAKLKLEQKISIASSETDAKFHNYQQDDAVLSEMFVCATRYLNRVPREDVSENQMKIDEREQLRMRELVKRFRSMLAAECMVVTGKHISELIMDETTDNKQKG